MSNESPVIKARVAPALKERIDAYLAGRAARSDLAFWTMSDFIVAASTAFLAHAERSRKRSPQPVQEEFLELPKEAVEMLKAGQIPPTFVEKVNE